MALLIIAAVAFWLFFLRGKQAMGLGNNSSAAPAAPTVANGAANYPGAPSMLDMMAQSIYQYEGGQPGNINFDNRNPGNLRSAPGQTGTSNGYATFGSFSDGWQALKNFISGRASAHPDWDFFDFFQNYLGQRQGGPAQTDQGDSDAYANYVANYLGVDPSQSVSSALQGNV